MDTLGPRQRLRITFGRGEAVKYITHLDLMRLWERMLRRARFPVSYSTSQPPRPRLALAAPLAVGVLSEGELLDVFLDARLPIVHLTKRLAIECPAGISINQVQEVGVGLPSVQSLVRFSEYRVSVAPTVSMGDVQERIGGLLAAKTIPRERLRDKEIRRYDLRPQIDSLWIAEWGKDEGVLGMLLQTDERATGRPDDVLSALSLGESERSVLRTKLILAPPKVETPPRAYEPRRRGSLHR
jgi:radical SAM-linked protein